MDATFEKSGPHYVLVVERRLAHPPEKVWRVLTERELLKQWFPCDVEGEWTVGSQLRFTFPPGEGGGVPEDQLRGEVLAVEPHRLLDYRWGDSGIRFELRSDGDGCVFRLAETHDDPSMGARNAAGWEMCLESLSVLIQGGTVVKFGWDVWRAKFEAYKKKFEPVHGPQQDAPEDHPAADTARPEDA